MYECHLRFQDCIQWFPESMEGQDLTEICGCKTMNDFVKDDKCVLIASILKGFPS